MMKRIAKSTMNERKATELDPAFFRVVNAFAADRQVTHGGGKGFGSGALKVKGKIFAMMSSKGEFVVKLPKKHVDALVDKGNGERFDPGRGRLMKEWVVVREKSVNWVELAREACDFVKRGGP
ncbi:MAG: hypothetical protein ACRD2G_14665 [Terriglobia bacterium]